MRFSSSLSGGVISPSKVCRLPNGGSMHTRSTLSLSSDFRNGRLSLMNTVPSSPSVLVDDMSLTVCAQSEFGVA